MIKTTAEKGVRIGNFLIDLIITVVAYYFVAAILIVLFPDFFSTYKVVEAVFYIVYFLYYLIFEYTVGKTIGKMVTKTTVVDKLGNKPAFWKLVLRTLLRFFPFDAISYLFGFSGFHDVLSGTKVAVNKNKQLITLS